MRITLDGTRKRENQRGKCCESCGDTGAPAYLVYNCRCTLIATVEGVDTSDAKRRARNPETGETELVSDMSYLEWSGWKEKEQKTVVNSVQSGTIMLPDIQLGKYVGAKAKNYDIMDLLTSE